VTSYRSLVDALLHGVESRGDRSDTGRDATRDADRDTDRDTERGRHERDRRDGSPVDRGAPRTPQADSTRTNGHGIADGRTERAMDSSGQEGGA
jgi:hypothetical protein